MAVRKELLERELRKRGFRKSEARTAGVPQQQQQQQPIKKVHPQADADADPHGD